MLNRRVRFVDSSESREVPVRTRSVTIPRDMDPEDGHPVLVADGGGAPVFRYTRPDGEEVTSALRPVPLGEHNPGDALLMETAEVDGRGLRRWREVMVRP